jgi:hypothetical protein
MSQLTADKFRRFIEDVKPSKNPDGILMSKAMRKA